MKRWVFVFCLSLAPQLSFGSNDCVFTFSWSPGMPISVMGLKEVEALTQRLRIKVDVIEDPSITPFSRPRAMGQNSTRKPGFSESDLNKGFANHYPGYFIRRGGRLELLRLGYMDPENIESALASAGCLP